MLTLSCLRRKLDANTNLQQANTQKTLKPISFQSREINQRIPNPEVIKIMSMNKTITQQFIAMSPNFIFASGDFSGYLVHKICESDIKQSILEFIFIFLKDLDDAVLRRFTKRIYVRLPCTADRGRLVQQLLGQQYNELSEREVHLCTISTININLNE